MKISPRNGPFLIACFYGAISSSWIFASDIVVGQFYTTPSQSVVIQTVKGLFFVGATTLLLYVLVKKLVQRQDYILSLVGASEASYRELFYYSPAPMIIFDLQSFAVLDANDAAERVCHRDRQTLRLLTLQELFPRQEQRLRHWVGASGNLQGNRIHDLVFSDSEGEGSGTIDASCRKVSYNGQPAGLVVLDYLEEDFVHLRNVEQTAHRLEIARQIPRHSAAFLLTGMGNDGAAGLKHIRSTGALTAAQDKQSCVVFGMPNEAIKLDAAAYVLPLDVISAFIQTMLRGKGPARIRSA